MAKPNAKLLDGGISHESQESPILEVGSVLGLTPANDALVDVYGADAPVHFPDTDVTDYFTLIDALAAIVDRIVDIEGTATTLAADMADEIADIKERLDLLEA